MRRIPLLMLFMCLLLLGCNSKNSKESKFDIIDSMSDSIPRQAISMLDSIDPRGLSESERHRYDLLRIKTRDKAYVRHTSDSLILDVIDYYESHQNEGHYPEALYYGGRVYSDIGDLPTALEYFQKAIDSTPDDERHLKLKSSVLSQTGRLLEDLSLYTEAVPYIDASITISKQLQDSTNVFYDHMQLISLYKHVDSLTMARRNLHEAMQYISRMPIEDKVWLEIENASLLLQENKIDSALQIIRSSSLATDSLCENYKSIVCANIYHAAGLTDSTYHYARKLIFSRNFNNKFSGFNILFSNDVYKKIPRDSIIFFVQAYGDHINEYLDRYDSEEAILQNSKYNYFLHKKEHDKAIIEKLRAEKDRNNSIILGAIIIIILLILILYLLYIKVKNEIKLRMAIQLVQSLEQINIPTFHEDIIEGSFVPPTPFNKIEHRVKQRYLLPFYSQQDTLRKELLIRLQNMINSDMPKSTIDEEINQSPVVKKLRKMLSENKGIKDRETKIWKDIEIEVHKYSPEFRDRLGILTRGKISEKEYRVALLMRCRFRPKEISDLLIRGKSTATDRRRSLIKKIFGESTNTSSLDAIILRL